MKVVYLKNISLVEYEPVLSEAFMSIYLVAFTTTSDWGI
jgi:hypothetical protein